MNGMVVFEGKSRIDGAPIVVILTALNGSMNTKTGHMVQSYIMRADIDPVKAAINVENLSGGLREPIR